MEAGRFKLKAIGPARDAISCNQATSSAPPLEALAEPHDPPCEGGPPPYDARSRVALLYRERAARLGRRLRARLSSSEEASDLVQDAFARLLGSSSLERLREPEAFLNRIVANLLVDRSRRLANRAVHLPLDGLGDIAVPADQAEGLELGEMRRRYRNALDSLPARMREVFVLHRIEELSYKDIASRLGISPRTVEWHIAEAIVRIGKELDRA